jgi:hypothetical protein
MLVSGEKFWVGGAGIGGVGGYRDLGIDVESYRRKTDFVVASLVMEL